MLNPDLIMSVKVWAYDLIESCQRLIALTCLVSRKKMWTKEHMTEGALAMDPQTMDLSKTTVETNTDS